MTREEYIQLRNANQLPIKLAYEYYKLKSSKNVLSFEDFSNCFQQFFTLFMPDCSDLYHYYDV
jgi:hypothetical protein